MKEIICSLLLLSSFSLNSNAQSEIPIGSWKSYLPHNKGVQITQSDDKVFYSTNESIFSIDKEDFSIDFLSKVEGLNDVGIAQIAFNKNLGQLFIAYNNGNIDIVTEDEVVNVTNILNNSNIQGDRTIYNIYIASNNKAYLATGFGIVEYNLETLEFGFTTKTDGIRINECTILNDYLYAATEEGVYKVSLTDNIIREDFNLWEFLDNDNNLPILYNAVSIATKYGKLFVATENTLFNSLDGVSFDSLTSVSTADFTTKYISEETEYLAWGITKRSESKAKIYFFDENNQNVLAKDYQETRPTFIIEDQQGRIWFGDERDGIRYLEDKNSGFSFIEINGPKSEKVYDLDQHNNIVYVAAGGVKDDFGNSFSRQGFYYLEDGTWINKNENNTSIIKDEDLISINQIAKHPSKDNIFAGSFWAGVLEYNPITGEGEAHDKDNSSLQGRIGDESRTYITELIFDNNENLWVSNFGAPNPISVFTNDRQWKNFSIGNNRNAIQMDIDQSGYIWIVNEGDIGGITVFDPGEDFLNITPEYRYITNANSEMPSSRVRCVEVDNEGDVWVGTNLGPIVFECGSGAIETDCRGSLRTILQNDIPEALLADVDIRTIETDGANRKWFGTRAGIFVQSPDGKDQIHHFTSENSPLFDNIITDLVYNPSSGEMFIGTESGLLSFRTQTTGGTATHSNSVIAFPNPVRPDYLGPIAIKGLANNASVKITDINGRLVHETDALGGQAIWDGNDYTGRRASTGVYLVFSASSDSFFDPNSYVTKILFIQ